MNIFTAIFGDRYAEKFGQALLEYFDRKDFPKELLQYPELNLLYCEFQFDKACRNGSSSSDELIACLDAMLAVHRKKLEEEASQKSGQ